MKKSTLTICCFILILYTLMLPIPQVAFGQMPVQDAKNVFNNNQGLLLREDIRLLLPKILISFKDSPKQDDMDTVYIWRILDNPTILWEIDRNVDGRFIGLLSTDIELYKFWADEQFFNVLKNDEAIDKLIELIKNAPTEPKKLEIVSGNFQQGNLNTPLEPFIVVVTDLYKGLYKEESPYNEIYPNRPGLAGKTVTFKIVNVEGNGTLSGKITKDDGTTQETNGVEVESTTNENGEAQATLIPGPNEGLILVEARVDVENPSPEEKMPLKQIFTVAVFTLDRPDPPVVNITPSQIVSPANSKKFTLNVNIKGGESIKGYLIIVKYDQTALNYVELRDDNGNPTFNGDYLSGELRLLEKILEDEVVLFAAFPIYLDSLESSGDGVLAKLAFEGIGEFEKSTVELVHVQLLKSGNSGSSSFIPNFGNDLVIVLGDNAVDVDGNGGVNVQDLILVVQSFGKTGEGLAEDVNGDGVVDILDLALVASAMGETLSAAPSLRALAQGRVSAADVQTWLTQAKASDPNIPESIRRHPDYQRGIAVLENLLSTLTQTTAAPKKTALLLNYPNPFNPETWIPYQLAEATDVTVTIHALNGILVRTLSLGHQTAGLYRNKNRAAYWDGKNEFGERVASGLYFYTLTAGKFSATGKMLIRK